MTTRKSNTSREESTAIIHQRRRPEKREWQMVWNNEGLNFYYTAERNWKEVHKDNDAFLDLCIKWERWEPEDKSRKNPIRMYWRKNEEQKDDIEKEEPVEWWEEQNVGSLRKVMRSLIFIGMMTSTMEQVMMIIMIK